MQRIKKKPVYRAVILMAFPICQILLMLEIYKDFNSKNWNYIILFGILLSIIAEVSLILVFKKNEKQEELVRTLYELEYSQRLQAIYEKNTEIQRAEIEQIKEQMKVAIHKAIEYLDSGENIENVIDQLKSEVYYNNENVYCNNSIIDAVLIEKTKECSRYGFKMNIDVSVGELKEIEKNHLCSIFSNLLDNAIAAQIELPANERMIWIVAGVKARYLIVQVINRTLPEYANRVLRENHGYGRKILEDISNIYRGNYKGILEGTLYKAVIILKIDRE